MFQICNIFCCDSSCCSNNCFNAISKSSILLVYFLNYVSSVNHTTSEFISRICGLNVFGTIVTLVMLVVTGLMTVRKHLKKKGLCCMWCIDWQYIVNTYNCSVQVYDCSCSSVLFIANGGVHVNKIRVERDGQSLYTAGTKVYYYLNAIFVSWE